MPTDEHHAFVSRKFTMREVMLAIGLLFNFGGFIWSAATTKATIDTLVVSNAGMQTRLLGLEAAVSRNALLEYRMQENERRLDKMEGRR